MTFDNFERFKRPTPTWFKDAKFGIFIHWGVYSVPAWAEPTGELGLVDDENWWAHNPYAEWYYNTILIEGSPAQKHHQQVYGGMPYDNFLDKWSAESFNPESWAQLFKKAGAQYIIPTTKHHDGIALWNAPGTGNRNTVMRGPKKDLIGAIEREVRKAGMKFGIYYSGGLDWSISQFPPLTKFDHIKEYRPRDAAYAMYCYEHLKDLISRYKPDILWGDIDYPDFGKREGEYSLAEIFDYFYTTVTDGVVNDRWQVPHSDFKTSEYQHMLGNESFESWENCRGIGLSFGYNQVEDEKHYISTTTALRHLIDIVSRGGNLLLNVGPTAQGLIPDFQRQVLEGVGDWLNINGDAIYGTRSALDCQSSDSPWVRWTAKGDSRYAIIEAQGRVNLEIPQKISASHASLPGGGTIPIQREGSSVTLEIPAPKVPGPSVIEFR